MEYIKIAIDEARRGMNNNEGGPFGAVIVDKNNKIIGVGNNKVIASNDPTAHAEMVAIRNACKEINSYNLEGATIYTTCEPCPMCLSAIIWANIKDIHYGSTRKDAEQIGFRDNAIYDYLKGNDSKTVNLIQNNREECNKLMEEYQKNNKTIY